MKANAKKGYFNGSAVKYGYKTKVVEKLGDKEKKKLTINKEEAEIVRLIFKQYTTCNSGAKGITHYLNSKGIMRRGKVWNLSRILYILSDESYIGNFYYNKRDKRHILQPKDQWILTKIPPIIDEESWETAKKILDNRRQINSAVASSPTLLTGLLMCALCGSRMSLETGKGYRYYNCNRYLRQGKSRCIGQRVRCDELEQAVIQHIHRDIFPRDRIKNLLTTIVEQNKVINEDNDHLKKILTKQIAGVDKRITNIITAIEELEGSLNYKKLGLRMEALEKDKLQLETQLSEIKAPITRMPSITTKQLDSFYEKVQNIFNGNEPKLQRMYLKLWIDKIWVCLPTLDICTKLDEIFDSIFSYNKNGWWAVQESNLRPTD